MHHESLHRRVWYCVSHDLEYGSQQDYVSHLKEAHVDISLGHLTSELMAAAVRPSSKPRSDCPFCPVPPFDSVSAMQKHIAFHLERLALYALPKAADLEEEDETLSGHESDSFQGQRLGRKNSIELDFSSDEMEAFSNTSGHDELQSVPSSSQNWAILESADSHQSPTRAMAETQKRLLDVIPIDDSPHHGELENVAAQNTADDMDIVESGFMQEGPGFQDEVIQSQRANRRGPHAITAAHYELASKLFDKTSYEDGLDIFHDYNGRYANILTSRGINDRTVLHTILDALQNSQTEWLQAFPPAAQEFLEHLIISHPNLLTQPDSDGKRPLDFAAANIPPIVFLVIDLVMSDEQLRGLPVAACLAKQKNQPPNACHFSLPKSLHLTFIKGPNDENWKPDACVHDTVDVDKLQQWNVQFKDTVIRALGPHETSDRGNRRVSVLSNILIEPFFDETFYSIPLPSFRHLIDLCPKETLECIDSEGLYPLHKAIKLYGADDLNLRRLHDAIRYLIWQHPSSIYLVSEGRVAQTPYSMLLALDPRQQQSYQRGKVDSWLRTVELLKYTCIGSERSRDEKMRYLYNNIKNGMYDRFSLRCDIHFIPFSKSPLSSVLSIYGFTIL